ncbi:pyruvate kinase [Streptococcus suis]
MIIQTINHIEDLEGLDKLLKLLKKVGIGGIRINLSKIPQDSISVKIKLIYNILANSGLEVYLDFPFPKGKPRIRQCNFCDDTKFKFQIKKGHQYYITTSKKVYNTINNCILLDEKIIFTSNKNELIYYSDGEGGFLVEEVATDYILVRSVNTFEGYIGKSIQCGYVEISDDFEKIIDDVNYSNFKYLFSFIENSNEVRTLAKKIDGSIIPKIETKLAVDDIENIVKYSDGILIARGDLALDIEISDYLRAVEKIVHKTRRKKDIIFCTDILICSEDRLIPYRSELFDLFLIKSLGCDKIVLPCSKSINLLTKGQVEDNQILDTIKTEITSKVNIINEIIFDREVFINER